MRTFFLLLPLFLFGCGGASMVLKSPVESKCTSSGLKGCPEMTDGVLLYISGDEAKGKEELSKSASMNSPEKLKQFAMAIKELHKVPGAGSYTAKLDAIADIILAAKAGPAEGGATVTKKEAGGALTGGH